MEEDFILTPCNHCNVTLQAPSNAAGHRAIFPNCGGTVVIGLKKNYVTYEEVHTEQGPKLPIIQLFIDISNTYFKSSRHKRYNNGVWDGSDSTNSMRAIEIKQDVSYSGSYLISLINLDGIHPQWGDNLQMSPKRMEVVSSNENVIELRGFGADPMLTRRPPQIQKDYGITIQLSNKQITSISLFFLDRGVRIDYFK